MTIETTDTGASTGASTGGAVVAGLLGEKLGMTQVWNDQNKLVPVTVVKAGPCVVTQVRTPTIDGYDAVQIGFGAPNPRRVTKPEQGHFDKAGVTPRRHVVELRTSDASSYTLGQELTADLFEAGQRVDVVGTSKGKGFAGTMKRHGFHGQRASHGVHGTHRKPGAIGGAATPSRVFKGTKMAGRMGAKQRNIQNITVVGVDTEKGLLLLGGAIPGPNGGIVLVRTAAKGVGK
ncbi:MAG TPA: 50S ribosomal protein L3 [Jiangellaceae bacterium]|nr:50S ribosomal protein L3 [Jiangellaceae bacterium]